MGIADDMMQNVENTTQKRAMESAKIEAQTMIFKAIVVSLKDSEADESDFVLLLAKAESIIRGDAGAGDITITNVSAAIPEAIRDALNGLINDDEDEN